MVIVQLKVISFLHDLVFKFLQPNPVVSCRPYTPTTGFGLAAGCGAAVCTALYAITAAGDAKCRSSDLNFLLIACQCENY